MAANISTKRQLDIPALMIGEGKKDIIADTTARTAKNYGILHAVTDVVFDGSAAMTDETTDSGNMNGVTLKAGDRYYGIITAVKLASGTLIAYFR